MPSQKLNVEMERITSEKFDLTPLIQAYNNNRGEPIYPENLPRLSSAFQLISELADQTEGRAFGDAALLSFSSRWIGPKADDGLPAFSKMIGSEDIEEIEIFADLSSSLSQKLKSIQYDDGASVSLSLLDAFFVLLADGQALDGSFPGRNAIRGHITALIQRCNTEEELLRFLTFIPWAQKGGAMSLIPVPKVGQMDDSSPAMTMAMENTSIPFDWIPMMIESNEQIDEKAQIS